MFINNYKQSCDPSITFLFIHFIIYSINDLILIVLIILCLHFILYNYVLLKLMEL